MDAIQSVLDVRLKRTIYNSNRFFLEQQELSEANYPLLVSYLAWLRQINATPNKIDVMHQNEQINREFKFLCKHNLLFFLTVTKQFNDIEKWFNTPSYTAKLRHLITFIKKKRYKIRQKKRQLLREHEFYLEKTLSASTKYADNNASFLMHSEEKSMNIKNSSFTSYRLTFFSPSPKPKKSMQLNPTFNFSEQKTENNMTLT